MPQRNSPERKAMLFERRIRQRSRRAGFTPVPNARINARIRSTEGILTLAYKAQADENGTAMPNPVEIHNEAVRAVARTLPATPIGVRTRYDRY